MTVIAVVAAGNMCRMLAGGSNAVVARTTGTENLGVIDNHHGREHIGGVAVFTDIGRQWVSRILASCVRAVMAVYAIAGDRRVVEECRQPASRSVTVIAGIAAGNMRRVFAGGNDAIMAGVTGSQYLRVIHSHHGRKHISGVAILADIRCLNVRRVFADCFCAVVTADTVTGDVQVIEIRR